MDLFPSELGDGSGSIATDATDGDNEEGAPDVRYEWRPSDRTAVPDP